MHFSVIHLILLFCSLLAIMLLVLLIKSNQKFFEVCNHLSDEEMIELFDKRKEELNELQNMINQDKEIKGLYIDSIDTCSLVEIGMNKNRIKKYKKLMKSIGLLGLIWENEGYYFRLTTEGMLDAGSIKGYAFLSTRPKNIYNKIDPEKFSELNITMIYKEISDNWYIYFSISE